MRYSKTEQLAYDIAKPIAENVSCYIYDVEYVKEGGVYFLRIYADKEGGISLDDCEAINRGISAELDALDPISDNYFLEVSSPGVERKLKRDEHFKMNIGKDIDIGLYKAMDGKKVLMGKLIGFDGKNIEIEIAGNALTIEREAASYIKLHFEFRGNSEK